MLDDDVATEEWMALTEAQQDAQINREMAEYNSWYDSLSREQQTRVDTRSALRSIMENRRRLRTPSLCTIGYVVGLWKDGVRRGQKRLVKIRACRETGIYPGEA